MANVTTKVFNIQNFRSKQNYVIEASAGTGKTYNITGIVKKLIDKNVKLEEILIVTYTEKAAGELRDRIRAKCPDEDVDNAAIFTIHSFCQKTLSEFSFTANQCAKLSLVDDDAIDDFIDRWIRDVLKNNSDFGDSIPPLKVELEGVEPSSKHAAKTLSTCLSLLWFSFKGWSKAKPSFDLSSKISEVARGGHFLSSHFRCLGPDVGRMNFRGDSFVTNLC